MADLANISIDEELDLSGEVCPYTFVKSKLALEDMDVDQVLRVVVDNSESASNVPRSMENEGQQVLDVSPISNREWQIIVRRKV